MTEYAYGIKTFGQIVFCPKCGKHCTQHDDVLCEYRFFHDEVNHELGWIPPVS